MDHRGRTPAGGGLGVRCAHSLRCLVRALLPAHRAQPGRLLRGHAGFLAQRFVQYFQLSAAAKYRAAARAASAWWPDGDHGAGRRDSQSRSVLGVPRDIWDPYPANTTLARRATRRCSGGRSCKAECTPWSTPLSCLRLRCRPPTYRQTMPLILPSLRLQISDQNDEEGREAAGRGECFGGRERFVRLEGAGEPITSGSSSGSSESGQAERGVEARGEFESQRAGGLRGREASDFAGREGIAWLGGSSSRVSLKEPVRSSGWREVAVLVVLSLRLVLEILMLSAQASTLPHRTIARRTSIWHPLRTPSTLMLLHSVPKPTHVVPKRRNLLELCAASPGYKSA